MLLAIETATDICSVAFKNGDDDIFEKRSETKGSHSENLFIFIDELMKKHSFSVSNLDAVLISEGPGSYTGLRIGASGVKGLLFENDTPLYAINTLASFAKAAAEERSDAAKTHSVIDAKRKHLYHQSFSFKHGNLTALNPVKDRPIEKIESMLQPDETVIGTGLERITDETLDKLHTFDKAYITAKTLFGVYQTGTNDFISEVRVDKFDPKYYTSNQAQSPA